MDERREVGEGGERGWGKRVEAANEKNRWMVCKVEWKDGRGGGAERAELQRERRGDCGGELF